MVRLVWGNITGGTLKSFIQTGAAPRSNSSPFLYIIWIEKVPPSQPDTAFLFLTLEMKQKTMILTTSSSSFN